MEITITIPSSATVTAEQFLETAMRHWGWDEAQGLDPQDYLLDRVEEQLHGHFRAGQRTMSRDQVEAELPRPESRGIRAHREREAAPETERGEEPRPTP
jgi:hypothetical protein